MAAAVHPPQMGVMGQHPHAMQQQYDYQNGYSVMEDSDDGHPQDAMDDDMEAYYRQHEYEQHFHQQQMLAQQNGMQYHHDDADADMDDGDMYDSDSSDESVLPDENIDFGLIYALHTFLATVEGQASVVKGDSLLLLDDANSYWWLVRVLKTEDVGYIPAENVETPYERLARLNKHRNIDIAAATDREKADAEAKEQKRRADGKLKSLIGWPRRGSTQPPAADPYDDDPETREGRRVLFGPLTFVDHPGVTWSSDEEDSDEEDAHDGDVEDEDHDVNMDHHINEQLGYDAEPDDGIEWAQDAVEAMRNADGSASSIEMRDSDMAPESHTHPLNRDGERQVGPEVAAGAGTAAAVGAAGLLAVNSSAASSTRAPEPSPDLAECVPGAFPPAPERSPSPSSSPVHGLAARALPTPPPHRAPPISPAHEASPEPPTREMTPVTPPAPTSSTVPTVMTPSSDFHGEDATRGHQPSASVASAVSAFSTTSGETPNHTPLRSSVQSEASSYSTPTNAGVLAAGAGAVAAAGVAAGAAAHTPRTPMSPTPMSPTGTTPASPASAGPPVGFVRSTDVPRTPELQRTPEPQRAPQQQAQEPLPAPTPRGPVAPLWYSDAFDISRLSTLVRARATDIKRNTPVPRPRRPAEPTDAVQRMLYGDRPEVEHMPPDLRAPFVHLQAKMDAFDREIDDLLGSLVAVY